MQSDKQFQQNRLINSLSIGMFVSGAGSLLLGPLMPYLREHFGFGYEITGTLLSMQSLGNFIATILAGFLPLLLGRRKSIMFTSIWLCIAYFLIVSGVGGIAVLLISCLMMGFARGGTSTFSNTMISTLPDNSSARGYNRIHGTYAFGAFISPLLLLLMAKINASMGWRMVAVVMGCLSFAQFLVFSKMTLPSEVMMSKKKKVDTSFFKNRYFQTGAVMIFCYISAEYAISGWLVTYFQDSGILTASQAQLMNSLFWLFICIGRLVGSKIVGRVSRDRLLIIDGIGFVICFVIMFLSRSFISITLSLVGVSLFMATIYPTLFSFGCSAMAGNDFGCSLFNFIGSVGGIITPFAVGIVAKNIGIEAGMAFVVGVVLLLLCTILTGIALTKNHKKVA